jgi:prepilin-type N-terminal cleavage/methylation domain-containing protein
MMKNKGLSIIEIIVVVAILGILSTISVSSLSKQTSYYALQKTAGDVASLLEKAHGRAVFGYNGVKHSVRLETSQAVLYEGTIYSSTTASNQYVAYDSRISLATTSLSSGTNTINFNKVIGTADQYGTIKFQITSATTSSSTITVGQTGIIQVQ